MIKVYEYLSKSEFIDKFSGLDNTSWADEQKALGVLYDHLAGLDDEAFGDMDIRDWLRFQVMEMTAEEIEEHYSNIIEGFSSVEDFLNDYTMLYGTYEHDGETYYLFGEF